MASRYTVSDTARENIDSASNVTYTALTPATQPFMPSKAYVTRKTVSQGALDIALFMANVSQLKALVDIPEGNRGKFFVALLVLLSVSIVLQVAAGLVLLILGMSDPKKESSHLRTERLNNASVCLIFLITVINLVISVLDIGYVDHIVPTNSSLSG